MYLIIQYIIYIYTADSLKTCQEFLKQIIIYYVVRKFNVNNLADRCYLENYSRSALF